MHVALMAFGMTIALAEVRTVQVPDAGKPAVARVDDGGTVHLIYQMPDGPQYVRSTDDGRTLSAAIPVIEGAAQPAGIEFTCWDMVVDGEGRVHVAVGTNAWKLKLPHEEWGYFYATLDPGAERFAALRNLNKKPSEGFSLAASADGSVTAVWLADKLYANVSRDGGRTFAPSREIDLSSDPCNCCTTSSVYAEDGRLAVLYREERNDDRDMFLLLWDQATDRVDRKRISVTGWKTSTCPMTYYAINRSADGFVAAWPTGTNYGIELARLDADGVVALPGVTPVAGHAGHRTGITALSASDGSTLVAWNDKGQVKWQVHDAAGRPSSPLEMEQTTGTGPAAVVTHAGDFVIFH